MLLIQLKTKDNVVHAGLSQPQLLSKDITLSNKEHFTPSQSNKLSIVIPHVTDAMVVGKLMPCNTFNKPVKPLKATTNTLQEMELAELLNTNQLLELLMSMLLKQDPNQLFLLLLLLVQPQLPLKQTLLSSKDTLMVFSTQASAEPNLIMPLPQLGMVFKTVSLITLSETHGVLHGEQKDTSTLLPLEKVQLVSVVSNKLRSGH